MKVDKDLIILCFIYRNKGKEKRERKSFYEVFSVSMGEVPIRYLSFIKDF